MQYACKVLRTRIHKPPKDINMQGREGGCKRMQYTYIVLRTRIHKPAKDITIQVRGREMQENAVCIYGSQYSSS